MSDKLNCLKCCITILLSLEILAGFILLSVTAFYHRILGAFFPKIERQELLTQMSNMYILGFQVTICFFLGFILWQYICKEDAIAEQSKLLILWNGFCTLAAVCGSVTLWFQSSNMKTLQTAYATSLFQGIDLYFSDPEWKLLWDGIQFNNECCGIFGFKDWEEAAWMPEEPDGCQPISESSFLMVMIPYACCKHSASSCFQSFAPHSMNVKDLRITLNDINMEGCLPKFKNLVFRFVHSVAGIWIASCITQVLLIVLIFCLVSRTKKRFNLMLGSEESDERPLVVVKYPRNVRCITLTDDDNFDEVDEEDQDNRRCQNCLTAGASIRHDIFDTSDARQNIFVH